jgi:hypothetical protein
MNGIKRRKKKRWVGVQKKNEKERRNVREGTGKRRGGKEKRRG